NVTVGLAGITINETATGGNYDYHYNEVYAESSGSLSTPGLITINANNSSSSYYTENYVYTDGGTGSLTALGVSINTFGSQYQDTEVWSDNGPLTVGLFGLHITGFGTGAHDDYIYAENSSLLKVLGFTTVFEHNAGSTQNLYINSGDY